MGTGASQDEPTTREARNVSAWGSFRHHIWVGSGNNNIMESQQVGSLGDHTRNLFLAIRDLLFNYTLMINRKEDKR